MITKQEIKKILSEHNRAVTDNDIALLLDYSLKRGYEFDELTEDINKTSLDKILSVRAPRFLASDVLSFSEFESILNINSLNTFSHKNKRELYEIFMSLNKNGFEMTYALVTKIIKGAKKLSIAEVNKYVDFNEVTQVIKQNCREQDFKLFIKFDDISKKFNDYSFLYGERYKVDSIIKESWKRAKKVCQELNVETEKLASEAVKILWALSCIYDSIVTHTGSLKESDSHNFRRVADEILLDKVLNKSALYFKKLTETYPDTEFENTQMYLFNEFLDELMYADNLKERFSAEDVASLLKHTPTLVFLANREKLIGAINAINMYIDTVLKTFPQAKIKKTSKDIFKKAGTILDSSPISNENSVRLLTGESMQEILAGDSFNNPSLSKSKEIRRQYMFQEFPNMKILDMDLNKHMYALNRRNTIFTHMTVEKIYNATANILSLTFDALNLHPKKDKLEKDLPLYKKNAALKYIGLETDKLFTGDNIFDIFDFGSKFIQNKMDDDSTKQNFINNIKVLSKLVPINAVLQIIQHNFVFLTQDNTKKYNKILSENKTEAELKQAIQSLVNTRENMVGSKKGGTLPTQERSNSKLIRQAIVLSDFNFDFDALKKMEFELNGELAPQPQKSTKSAPRKIDYSRIFDDDYDLEELELQINNEGSDDIIDEQEEEEEEVATKQEQPQEIDKEIVYEITNNLTFELESISDYLRVLKNDDDNLLSESDWNSSGKYYGTVVSKILSLNGFKIRDSLRKLKSDIAIILDNPSFDEYNFDTKLPIIIKALDDIIAQKQENKQFLFEVVKDSYKAQKPAPNEDPTILQKAIKTSEKYLKSAKGLKDKSLLNIMAQSRKYLQEKLAQAQATDSAYNRHIRDKRTCGDAIKEWAEIDAEISSFVQLKDVVEGFYSKISSKNQAKQKQADEVLKIQQQEDATRMEEIKAELKEIETKISNLTFKMDSEHTAISKIEKQFGDSNPSVHKTAYKRKMLEKHKAELEKLKDRKAQLENEIKNLSGRRV